MSREELYDLFVDETGDIETGEVDNNYFEIWLEERMVNKHGKNFKSNTGKEQNGI